MEAATLIANGCVTLAKSLNANKSAINNAANAVGKIPGIIKTLSDVRESLLLLTDDGIIQGHGHLNMIILGNTDGKEKGGLIGIFKSMSDNKKAINDAPNLAKNMGRAVDDLVKASNNSAKFEGLRTNLERNIVEPLMKLDIGVQKLNNITNAVTKLNSELTKMTAENKSTLTAVASIGNSNENGILKFITTIPGKLADSMKAGKADAQLAELKVISKKVVEIEKRLTPEEPSWFGKGAKA
jgi:hypothetical protein